MTIVKLVGRAQLGGGERSSNLPKVRFCLGKKDQKKPKGLPRFVVAACAVVHTNATVILYQ